MGAIDGWPFVCAFFFGFEAFGHLHLVFFDRFVGDPDGLVVVE